MPPKKTPPPPKTTPHKRQRPSPKAKKPVAAESKFAIQAEDLNVSGFCVAGATSTTSGPPGGAYYEKAKSRHRRHREVYRSSVEGQAVAEGAVPLGGGGKRRPETSARRKAILDAAKKMAAAAARVDAAPADSDGKAASKPKQSPT